MEYDVNLDVDKVRSILINIVDEYKKTIHTNNQRYWFWARAVIWSAMIVVAGVCIYEVSMNYGNGFRRPVAFGLMGFVLMMYAVSTWLLVMWRNKNDKRALKNANFAMMVFAKSQRHFKLGLQGLKAIDRRTYDTAIEIMHATWSS